MNRNVSKTKNKNFKELIKENKEINSILTKF